MRALATRAQRSAIAQNDFIEQVRQEGPFRDFARLHDSRRGLSLCLDLNIGGSEHSCRPSAGARKRGGSGWGSSRDRLHYDYGPYAREVITAQKAVGAELCGFRQLDEKWGNDTAQFAEFAGKLIERWQAFSRGFARQVFDAFLGK